jgi:hypothetical protein
VLPLCEVQALFEYLTHQCADILACPFGQVSLWWRSRLTPCAAVAPLRGLLRQAPTCASLTALRDALRPVPE